MLGNHQVFCSDNHAIDGQYPKVSLIISFRGGDVSMVGMIMHGCQRTAIEIIPLHLLTSDWKIKVLLSGAYSEVDVCTDQDINRH